MPIETFPALRPARAPWNKGRIVGQKRPLLPKHLWSIRVRLEMADSKRDLALFNMAINCKLRGCDLVCLKVNDVYAVGRVKERASVMQSKTRKPVRFEITETTRLTVERWGTSDQRVRLRRDSGLIALLGGRRGSGGGFRPIRPAVGAVSRFSGRLVLMPSISFGPVTGC